MGLETPQAGGCNGQKPLSLGRCFGGHWLGFQAGKVGRGGERSWHLDLAGCSRIDHWIWVSRACLGCDMLLACESMARVDEPPAKEWVFLFQCVFCLLLVDYFAGAPSTPPVLSLQLASHV